MKSNLTNRPWCPELCARTPSILIALSLVGALALAAAVVTPSGLAGLGASKALAATQTLQDELQIQLDSNGFTPSEVQHAAGTFAIAVENLAISGEYTLRLKAEDGTVVKEIQVQKGSAGWTVTLSAGQYTLSETNHPQWVCRITVQ